MVRVRPLQVAEAVPGVPPHARQPAAIPVMDAEERLYDRHNREQWLYHEIEHPSLGMEPIFNFMWNLDRTPRAVRGHAPLPGQHSERVSCGLLEMTKEEVKRLEEDQILR